MQQFTRRKFIQGMVLSTAAVLNGSRSVSAASSDEMRFGLVTYLWGAKWDLPTLIQNCEQSGVLGVELRTTHSHGVERNLSKAERAEIKKRFAGSPVELVGIGSNERYDDPNADTLGKAVEATKAFIELSHDVGGSGVKVKPDSFHENVPHEKTIDQIGKTLNELGAFGDGFGQEIRLEVHGQCSELPIIKQIIDIADHPNVAVCWNSNDQDLIGEGLEHNFNLVKDRFGATAHVRELNIGNYPYADLMRLFVDMDYEGWVLLEARTKPEDPVAALTEQRELFEKMIGQG